MNELIDEAEYNLIGAGFFKLEDLLDFQLHQQNIGKDVKKVWLTSRQAANLVSQIEGYSPPKTTGKKLVDYWYSPKEIQENLTIHGIEIWIEN